MPTGGRAAAGSRAGRGRRRARRGEAFLTNAVKHFKCELRGKRRIHSRQNAGEIGAGRWGGPRAGAGPPAADGGARGHGGSLPGEPQGAATCGAGPDHQDPGGGSSIHNTVPVIPVTLAQRARRNAGKCAVCGGAGRGEGAGRPPVGGGAGHPILTACAVWAMQLYRRPPPRGPFVYRLGHLVFNQGRGVRLP